MKSKLIRELHSVSVYRHPVTRQKLESLKTSEIINIWSEHYNKKEEVAEGVLATEEV